jgi:hypothetical protein
MRINDGASGGSVTVDYAALAATSARIRGIIDDLAGPQTSLAAMIGDPAVSAALDSAERDWSAQRKRLLAFFELALAGISSAILSYQQTDSGIAAAALPAGSASAGAGAN